MIISLTDHAVVGKVVEFNEDYINEYINVNHQDFKIIKKSPISIVVSCEEKDKIKFLLKFEIVVLLQCDRCLEDVDCKICIDYEDEFSVEDISIDTDDILLKEIILNWPMKVLCRDDCKGLCLKCGLNLNKDHCECDTFIPDPRMAAIKDIFESER